MDAVADALLAAEAHTPRLSAAEVQRASRFSDARSAREWLASHIALRLLIERFAGTSWRTVPFALSPRGKPGLAGARFDFSLSHAPGIALVGLSRDGSIGVDVERPRFLRLDARRRARIEAAASELAETALPPAGEARTLQAWVRLEALAKADGCGMGRLLTRLGVIGVPASARGTPLDVPPDILPPERGGCGAFRVRDVDLGEDRFAAVACAGGAAPSVVQALRAGFAGLK